MSVPRDKVYSPRELMGLLHGIEERSQACARSLSNIALPQQLWHGLVFTLGGVRLVCAMSQVSEILPSPDAITRVPGARDWVLGLANVRGTLLPLVDLQAYLGDRAVVRSKASRVLVLRQRQLTTGLLVPGVQGMRQFDLAQRIADFRVDGAIGEYVYDAFRLGREVWPVFNMSALAADPRFRTAAG